MPNTIEIRIQVAGAEEASRVLQGLATSGAKFGQAVVQSSQDAANSLNGLGASARRVFEIFSGINLASAFETGVRALKEFAVEAARVGLEARAQEDAFNRLTSSIGVSSEALLSEMRRVWGGLVDTSSTMTAASKALLEGLQPEQIVRLMEIARQQAKLTGQDVTDAFNVITEAIANQAPKQLRSIGLNVDAEAAYRKMIGAQRESGVELTNAGRSQALYNAVIAQAAPQMAALTQETLTQKEQVQLAQRQWHDFQQAVGGFLVDAGFGVLGWFQDIGREFPNMQTQLQQLGVIWKNVWGDAASILEPVGLNLKNFIIATMKEVGVIAAAMGVAVTTAFSVIAGPIAYLASILSDLAHARLPDVEEATKRAGAAQEAAAARVKESMAAFSGLVTGQTAATQAQEQHTASLNLGRSALAGSLTQTNQAAQSYDALARAMRALSEQGAQAGLPEREREVRQLARGVVEAAAAMPNLSAGLRAFYENYAEQIARG